jgi:DNA-directed RNA polymerase subunit M/transcription elongation factor TFIIS
MQRILVGILFGISFARTHITLLYVLVFSNNMENNKMSTTKLDPQASETQLVPLLVPAETKTKHQITQTAPLTEDYTAASRSIQPPNRNLEKHKQPLSFCPTCKMLLRTPANCPSSLKCKKCGYKITIERSIVFDATHSNHHGGEIAVIDREKGKLRTNPIVQAICEKCGKTESETWAIAVGSDGTTGALTFLRCVDCGFTRREVG